MTGTDRPGRTILVTGASGQVGGALVRLLRGTRPDLTVAAPSRAEMDLADPPSIRAAVTAIRPDWIVSAAAYTAVDAAETDRDAAFAANATAPGVLAESAAAIGAGLIHFSTDYVFPGTGTRPWTEDDIPSPLNVYGESKLAGERAVLAAGGFPLILRTSWVYSGGGKNFVRTMFRLLSTRDTPLRIVNDQHGSPTAAADLAEAALRLMDLGTSHPADLAGVYHCAGSGETTWAGLADAVRDYLQSECGLQPPAIQGIPGAEYPVPAKRPENSRLDCDKLQRNFGIRLPDWRKSVAAALRELAAEELPKPVPG